MSRAAENPASNAKSRGRYHHGALREALIAAAYDLISTDGAQAFTMADAARHVGVSSAAPYRHFSDREALMDAVCGLAFERFSERLAIARDTCESGSIEAIIAMGKTYVEFASDSRSLFELMWSRHIDGISSETTEDVGRRCFQVLLDAVTAYRIRNRIEHPETLEIAVALWLLVHGTASLVLGKNLEVVAPGIHTEKLLADTTRAYFAGLTVAKH